MTIQTPSDTLELSEDQAYLLAGALRIAADRYAEDAKAMDAIPQKGLADQFRHQEAQARNLCDRLAELGYV